MGTNGAKDGGAESSWSLKEGVHKVKYRSIHSHDMGSAREEAQKGSRGLSDYLNTSYLGQVPTCLTRRLGMSGMVWAFWIYYVPCKYGVTRVLTYLVFTQTICLVFTSRRPGSAKRESKLRASKMAAYTGVAESQNRRAAGWGSDEGWDHLHHRQAAEVTRALEPIVLCM